MDHDSDVHLDAIELGTASVETKGPSGPVADFSLGQILTGLNDD